MDAKQAEAKMAIILRGYELEEAELREEATRDMLTELYLCIEYLDDEPKKWAQEFIVKQQERADGLRTKVQQDAVILAALEDEYWERYGVRAH